MKPLTQNKLALAIVVAAVAVATAALVMTIRLSYRPDDERVLQLIDQRLAKQEHAKTETTLSEERVIGLIEERLPSPTKDGLSEKDFNARVEKAIVAFIDKQRRAQQERPNRLARNVPRPEKSDHIYGSAAAPVTLIEYSDFECPFCKRFHDTVKRVVDQSSAKVKWVYRHFPLEELHPGKARQTAIASECAADLGGNDAFWKFTDRFFELTPSNNRTDTDRVLPQIAREIGLDEKTFAACLTSGKHDKRIEEDHRNAIATGGNGTPWSIVLSKSGKTYVLSGAQPYAAVKQLTERALQEK